MTEFTPRPSQKKILRYRGGRLGIAAVPGAGKTYTLSALAADLIARGALGPDQEVLIVTLVNSAVDNFSHRIGAFVQQRGLIPHLGYRVRTLHGLAHDIVREKPGRVGLEERFSIVDEREADFIRRESARAWLAAHPYDLDDLLDPVLEGSRLDWVRKKPLPELLDSLSLAFIRSSKDRRLTPENLRARLEAAPAPLPLASLGLAIYADYQRALAYRGAVDFDDLIRLALDLLERDVEFLERLRYRANCRRPFWAGWPGKMATGCASATPTRPSSRPLPPLRPNCCGASSARTRTLTCPNPAAASRRSSHWPTT
jgi:DNA helicase-2/ATP-dependent DNA helicase PcrA